MNELPGKVLYVAKDAERAAGMTPGASYMIATNRSQYAESLAQKYPGLVHMTAKTGNLDTLELLKQDFVADLLSDKDFSLVVFKNNSAIEELAAEKGWRLINPESALSERIENKISQTEWLGELGKRFLPAHEITETRNIRWQGAPIVVQWAHGHTGSGTTIVESVEMLEDIKRRFPERPARVSEKISGKTFTVNAVVADDVLVGNISHQITGLPPFTDNPLSTVGNDWGAALAMLSADEIAKIRAIAGDVGKHLGGERLGTAGWRGLFGLDFIMDDSSRRICLLEVNARQPASTTYESILETAVRAQSADAVSAAGLTVFEAHLLSLLGAKIDGHTIPITGGAQIVQRVTAATNKVTESKISALRGAGFDTISYDSDKPNADLLRIMSRESLVGNDGNLNAQGLEVAKIILG